MGTGIPGLRARYVVHSFDHEGVLGLSVGNFDAREHIAVVKVHDYFLEMHQVSVIGNRPVFWKAKGAE